MDGEMSRMLASLGISPNDMAQAASDPAAMQHIFSRIQAARPGSGSSSSERGGVELEGMIKNAEATFEREKLLPPGPAPPLSRPMFIQSLNEARRASEAREASTSPSSGHIRTTIVGIEKHVSHKDINDLKPILLSNMQIRKVHTGHYLLCRIITPPCRFVAIQFGIEDMNGDVQLMALYNYPQTISASTPLMDALFPIGTTIAIKEPTFKMNATGSQALIRVDSPTDVVLVRPTDPLLTDLKWATQKPSFSPAIPSTAPAWKDAGDKHFKDRLYLPAAIAYSNGIDVDPTLSTLRLNRSMAYLRLEYFSAALTDCKFLLQSVDLPPEQIMKATYRAGLAEYGLRQWEKAKSSFETCLQMEEATPQCHESLSRTLCRLNESREGVFDWTAMFEAGRRPSPRLDIADFQGPVKVAAIPARGGGRGVVASRDIKIGELLVVSKAYIAVFKEDLKANEILLSLNLLTKAGGKRCQTVLFSNAVEKLACEPAYTRPISDLYPGPNQPPPPFTYSPLPDISLPTNTHPSYFSAVVDVGKIEGILTYNCFTPSSAGPVNFEGDDKVEDVRPDSDDSASALFLLPALFNHSCDGNTHWKCFGDVMVLRASRDVSEGTELLLSYFQDVAHEPRQKHLAKWFPECTCDLCLADRADGEVAISKRVSISNDFEEYMKTGPADRTTITNLKKYLKTAQNTYHPDRNVIRPELFRLHAALAQSCQRHGMVKDDLLQRFASLKSAGLDVIDQSITGPILQSSQIGLPISTSRLPMMLLSRSCCITMLNIASTFYHVLVDQVRAERWMRALWWVEENSTSAGTALLKMRYKTIMDEMRLTEFNDQLRVVRDPSPPHLEKS